MTNRIWCAHDGGTFTVLAVLGYEGIAPGDVLTDVDGLNVTVGEPPPPDPDHPHFNAAIDHHLDVKAAWVARRAIVKALTEPSLTEAEPRPSQDSPAES